MLVEQAIFTSARTQRHQGYQLVARSPGVNEELVQFLSRWGPSHGALAGGDVDATSLNYIPADPDWAIISRTLHGGPEYSGRGALQVVTLILVLKRKQLAGYKDNPVTLARTAKLLGHLWLRDSFSEKLPTIVLPDRAPEAVVAQPAPCQADYDLIERSVLLAPSERLAVIGAQDPELIAERVIAGLPLDKRRDLSFATGLVPSQHRRFRVHMFPELDTALHGRLSQQGIRFVASQV